MDDLDQIHKRERKELNAKIQHLKHSVPKGDKKRKKEVQIQVALLEAELDLKQAADLKLKTNIASEDQVDVATEYIGNFNIDKEVTGESNNVENADKFPVKKISKAQKRRTKKAEAERVREARIQDQEIENLSGQRHLEAQNLKQILKSHGLALHEIPSDGNCLYASIVHQLDQEDTIGDLRKRTACYMKSNPDEFLPFLTNQDTGDPYSQDEYDNYCNEVETTPAWGGQLEIKALCMILQRPIEVIQAEAPPVIIGEEFKSARLLLPYYRHAYKLGEHYNSVKPLTVNEDEEDSFS